VLTVRVDVVLADDAVLGAADQPADEKTGDIQALPDGEVVADDDRSLDGEVGDRHAYAGT